MRVLSLFSRLAVIAAVLLAGVTVRAADDPAAAAVSAPSASEPPASVAPASAAPTPTVKGTSAKRFPKLSAPSLLHKYQLGLSVLPGSGFRIIAPYQEAINCGQQAKRVCTGRLPFFIDVQPSFGFAEHWDVLIDLRFGVESDFTRSREFAIAPGVRYWVDADLPTKFFATIQGVYDATTQNNVMVRNGDFGIRNSNGFMFEVMRNLGFYLQFGETVAFARWMRFEIDGGIGVQARIP